MASSIDRVKQSIRERLDELEAERDQLMKALEALTGSGASPVGGRRGRPPGSGTGARKSRAAGKRGGGERAPRGQRRQQVLDALQGGEKGPSEIARDLGVNATQVSGLLRQLASEGLVGRSESGKWQLAGAGSGAQEQAAPAATSSEAAPVSEPHHNGPPSPEQTDHGEF